MRLASVATHGVRGLPDVESALQPVTALIGPRGGGKSSLLRAVSWLLSGSPDLSGESFAASRRSCARRPRGAGDARGAGTDSERSSADPADPPPTDPLPPVIFLAARDRFHLARRDAPRVRQRRRPAEAMVAAIAERRLSGAEGEVLLIEEPELMLTVAPAAPPLQPAAPLRGAQPGHLLDPLTGHARRGRLPRDRPP